MQYQHSFCSGARNTNEVSTLTGDSKHILSPLYFYNSNKPTRLATEIWNACQGLLCYAKAEYSLVPRKQWFRIVKLEEEMTFCFIFFLLCPCHSYNSVLGLAATPTRVKIFIPSVHLKSNIQNISFNRLIWYCKENGRTKEKLTYSLPLLGLILNIMLLNSFGKCYFTNG